MYNIARIEELRVNAEAVLREQEQQLMAKPDSLFRRGLVMSSRARIDELTSQLVQEKQKREIEVIEIRLMGKAAYYGSLPMNIVGQLAEAFEDMLVQAGRFIRYGSQKKDTLQEIRNQFDVRLNRMAAGSTRLFVTVQTSPDLFGNSLSEKSLEQTFGLLTVDKPDDMVAKVATYGKAGVRGLTRFLKTLNESHLEAEVNWLSPTDADHQWKGTTQRISQLTNTFENFIANAPEEVRFQGIVYTESMRGRFEVKDQSGLIYSGSVSKEVMPSLVALQVGEECQGVLWETVRENQTTGEIKRSYELKRIAPVQASRKTNTSQMTLF